MLTNQSIVLVTGATAGIGRATAEAFLDAGCRVIATGRRADRLRELAAHRPTDRLLTLQFDVRDREACESVLSALPEGWREIDVLVNNAGLARGLDDVANGQIDDWEEMIDTNLKGLLYVSRIVSRSMIERRRGHVINVGSTAGKEAYPNGNVYCATKHGVDALTKGMRMDWVRHGLKVSAIHPGYVASEFSLVRFHGDADRAEKVYQGFQPLQPEDVAQVILYMAQAPAHVNLADVVVMCTAQASSMVTHREG